MDQPNQAFAYEQLRLMSFIQLFHLFVLIASRNWTISRDQLLVEERAFACERRRSLQPAYAAVFLRERSDAHREPPGKGEDQTLPRKEGS